MKIITYWKRSKVKKERGEKGIKGKEVKIDLIKGIFINGGLLLGEVLFGKNI